MNKPALHLRLLNERDARTIRGFQKNPPINVVRIASAFGLKVFNDDLAQGVSGKIFRDAEFGGPSGFSIVINSKEPALRQRFTIAHEIAHYLLHRDKIGDGIIDDALYRSGLSSSDESKANGLAADILMPFDLIESEVRKGKKTIEELADLFRVSQAAMSVRLGIPA